MAGAGAGVDLKREDGITRGARAIVVAPELGRSGMRDVDARLAEAVGLAGAIGLNVVDTIAVKIRSPRAATLFGSGQVETLATAARAHDGEVMVVDTVLTPIQQRNLETATGVKVIDRTGLILEIFGERAVSAEGRLQVELAHLDYQAGRLVRSWTHLERQRGGFGFLGGPGETQIEADRRLIRDRMAKLRRELDQVVRTRGLHRDRRQRAPWPVVALVGYTNAGKSTLFNRLTGSAVMAEDLLFATLDPTMRSIALPAIGKVILSDTVGFVSDLPTQLVAAFRATLEEVRAADILIHVRDIAHADSDAQAADVRTVLADLDIAVDTVPIIEAWNKIDTLDDDDRTTVLAEASRRDDVVAVAASTGEGVDALLQLVTSRLTIGHRVHRFDLATDDGEGRAWLYAHGRVEDQHDGDDQTTLFVRLSDDQAARYLSGAWRRSTVAPAPVDQAH